MKKKRELLKECIKILETPKVQQWYNVNFLKQSQYEAINSLEKGISKGELTIREALSISLIVGLQWYEEFEGVN